MQLNIWERILEKNVSLFGNEELHPIIVDKWMDWVKLEPKYQNKLTWWIQTKEKIKNILDGYSKNIISMEKAESKRLKQELGNLVNDLANGKRVSTKFRQVKETIRKRDFKKLQALKVRSHTESLDNSNEFDAEFFRQLKENQKKTYIHALKENKSNADSVTTPYEKLKVDESFY